MSLCCLETISAGGFSSLRFFGGFFADFITEKPVRLNSSVKYRLPFFSFRSRRVTDAKQMDGNGEVVNLHMPFHLAVLMGRGYLPFVAT